MDGVILALESSGDGGGAAVMRGAEVAAHVAVTGPRVHGAELMACVDRACVQAKVNRAQIDVIAVNCGPGSYTGLRIGLASAAGIGRALERPVLGVPCFDAMAVQYVGAQNFNIRTRCELWPVLDARRDEVMTARLEYAAGQLKRLSPDELLAPEVLRERAAHGAVVFGAAVPVYQDRLKREEILLDRREFVLTAAAVGLQAWRQLSTVEDWRQLPLSAVAPRYFREITAKTVEQRAGVGDTETAKTQK
ncbi:MAG: tRNA (adenosine(37)-N6)-threonylcarbamoyltransferase complex dimerization subunit type 1 TsaB [Planctomycetes bacterium]|nr:tRNA (adenosine(37)-N6)-threonylcarbamoyltransferase complex dimerization subunit type 1 TsaB [Planctomycetota bacterium]